MNHPLTPVLRKGVVDAGDAIAIRVQYKLEKDLQLLRSCVTAFTLATEHDEYQNPQLHAPDLMQIIALLIPSADSVQAIGEIMPAVLDTLIDAERAVNATPTEPVSRRTTRAGGSTADNALHAGVQ